MDGWCLRRTGCRGKVHKVIDGEEDCVFKGSMKVVLLWEWFVKSFKSFKIVGDFIVEVFREWSR